MEQSFNRRVIDAMDVEHVARGGLHGKSSAGCERTVHDHHGNENAFHRPGITGIGGKEIDARLGSSKRRDQGHP